MNLNQDPIQYINLNNNARTVFLDVKPIYNEEKRKVSNGFNNRIGFPPISSRRVFGLESEFNTRSVSQTAEASFRPVTILPYTIAGYSLRHHEANLQRSTDAGSVSFLETFTRSDIIRLCEPCDGILRCAFRDAYGNFRMTKFG